MDGTVTPAGARLLERWLCAPELDLDEIQRRQNCVGEFVTARGLSTELQQLLRGIRDIERILGRLQNRMRNPANSAACATRSMPCPSSPITLLEFPGTPVAAIASRIHNFDTLCETLANGLADELPGKIDDGGTIRDGYDEQLDHYRSLTRDSQKWLAEFELAEQERTGIKNSRIRYNGAFGYFIEVTKANLVKVPEDYVASKR